MTQYSPRKNVVIMDIECYPNYFLVAFRDTSDPKRIKHFEMRGDNAKLDTNGIKAFLQNATIVTFNGNAYDMPLLTAAMSGLNCTDLKEASDTLINDSLPAWKFLDAYGCRYPEYLDHIDIFPIPAGKNSLKMYAARIGCDKLQDLPYDPFTMLDHKQMDEIAAYCNNDTANTKRLYEYMQGALQLRIDISNQYGIDVRSKSDAQIGEWIFKTAVERDLGKRLYAPDFDRVRKRFKYDAPAYIHFNHPDLKKLYELATSEVFTVAFSGHTALPKSLTSFKPEINGKAYTVGIGGLHSNEKAQSVVAQDGFFIVDVDVGSYYPSIIIEGGYYPAHCGKTFLKYYKQFKTDRLKWKKDPTKALTVALYKIALNGPFGKLSSKYSFLFDPKMLVQVTITGQLCLLMLIEQLEEAGLSVISANTDGIVIHGKNELRGEMEEIIGLWEIDTGFSMEYTEYQRIHSQSVNSYIALKKPTEYDPKPKWKRKGDYAERSMTQSGNNQVCTEAVMAYLEHGTPLRESIEGCSDYMKFTNIEKVTGGAYKDGRYLGKVIRWYYSTETDTPILKANGNKVPQSVGAKPMMDLPTEPPTDIDFNWYIREAHEMLDRIGVKGVELDREAFGFKQGVPHRWGSKEGRKTYHLIDQSTREALCEARLDGRHDDWQYIDGEPTENVCGKCGRKA